MKGQAGVASAYARSLLDIAEAEGILESVSKEVYLLKKVLESDFAVREFLRSDDVQSSSKISALENALSGKVSPVFLSFVGFVLSAGRGRELKEICDKFVELVSSTRKRVFVEVTSAVRLDQATIDRIADLVFQRTKASPLLNIFVDKSIVGGVIIKFDGTVIDLSVKSRLEELKEMMIALEEA